MRCNLCKTCLCESCLNNAETYTDGLCRDCEQCEIEDFSWHKDGVGCSYYSNDSDINRFL